MKLRPVCDIRWDEFVAVKLSWKRSRGVMVGVGGQGQSGATEGAGGVAFHSDLIACTMRGHAGKTRALARTRGPRT